MSRSAVIQHEKRLLYFLNGLSNEYNLRGPDTLGKFSAMFYKGDNYCDFTFAFLTSYPIWKRVYSERKEFAARGSKFLSFRVDQYIYQKGC